MYMQYANLLFFSYLDDSDGEGTEVTADQLWRVRLNNIFI